MELCFPELDEYLRIQKNKIIHQVWFGTIPNREQAKKTYLKLKQYRESWTKRNHNWVHIEWSRRRSFEFVKRYFPEYYALFRSYRYEIQRCDVIRYLLLYRYGGWYADMDYYCNRPLDEAMSQYPNKIYFVQTPNTTFLQDEDYISNSLMYSEAGHQYWKCVMAELEEHSQPLLSYGKHLTVMLSTGPARLNKVYVKYKEQYEVKSLPWKLFHPYGVTNIKLSLHVDDSVFAIHCGKGSWEDVDSKVFLFFFRDWKIVLFIVFVLSIPIIKAKIRF